jgi:hypothetical protein
LQDSNGVIMIRSVNRRVDNTNKQYNDQKKDDKKTNSGQQNPAQLTTTWVTLTLHS